MNFVSTSGSNYSLLEFQQLLIIYTIFNLFQFISRFPWYLETTLTNLKRLRGFFIVFKVSEATLLNLLDSFSLPYFPHFLLLSTHLLFSTHCFSTTHIFQSTHPPQSTHFFDLSHISQSPSQHHSQEQQAVWWHTTCVVWRFPSTASHRQGRRN